MRENAKKVTFVLLFLTLGVVLSSGSVSAQTITQNLEILQGTTRSVEYNCSDVEEITITDKDFISAEGKAYEILVTAKKAGQTSFTYRLPDDENTYICNVTVHPLQTIKMKANAKLKKKFASLPKGTSYTYFDFNKDGVKELFHNGKITYYDYEKNKCKTVNYGFKEIYTSQKSKQIYVVKKKPLKTKYFTYFSEFYTGSSLKLFELTGEGTGFRTYTKKGIKKYKAKAPYAYYDDHYDQDDYDYEALTKKEMNARIKKKMPGYKKVVLKEK